VTGFTDSAAASSLGIKSTTYRAYGCNTSCTPSPWLVPAARRWAICRLVTGERKGRDRSG
jgi:hypothetical protein